MPTFGENLGARRLIKEVNPADVRYAWFSKKMCVAGGGEAAIYEMEDGTIRHVTHISTTPEHGCGWDDIQFLGETTSSGYRGRELVLSIADTPYLSLKALEMKKIRILDDGFAKTYYYHDIPIPTKGEVLLE